MTKHNIILFQGEDIDDKEYIEKLGYRNIEIIGDGKKRLSPSDIPKTWGDSNKKGLKIAILSAHGGVENRNSEDETATSSLIIGQEYTIDSIKEIYKKLQPDHFVISCCYNGSLYHDLIRNKDSFPNTSFVIISSSKYDTYISHIFKLLEYYNRDLEINDIISNIIANIAETIFYIKIDQEKKIDIFKSRAPKKIEDIKMDFFGTISEGDKESKEKTHIVKYSALSEESNKIIEKAKKLIQDPVKYQEYLHSSLFIFTQRNKLEMVKKILELQFIDINTKNQIGEIPLYWACINGHFDIAQLLVYSGADINARDNYGATPLHWACINGHFNIAKLLIDSGVYKEAKDNYGATPLHWASINGHVNIAQLLIDSRTDINARDNDGEIPLHWACYDGHFNIAKLLIDSGADIDINDNNIINLLNWACSKGHFNLVQLLINNIENKDVNINIQDNNGATPLHWACINGHFDIAKLLIDSGVYKEAKDNYGATPLHWASINGHLNIAQLLIDSGANKKAGVDNIQIIGVCE